MSTRLYSGYRTPTGLSIPTPNPSHWDVASGYATFLGVEGKEMGVDVTLPAVTESQSGVGNLLSAIWVVPCLAAQTIAGTVSGMARGFESNAAMDAGAQLVIRAFDPVTNNIRGTLLAPNNYSSISAVADAVGNEWSTGQQHRRFPSGWSGAGESLTSTDVEDGDCLSIEWGSRFLNTSTTPYSVTMVFTCSSATDQAVGDGAIGTNSHWIEFSQTINFLREAVAVGGLVNQTDYPDVIGVDQPEEGVLLAGQLWPRGAGG